MISERELKVSKQTDVDKIASLKLNPKQIGVGSEGLKRWKMDIIYYGLRTLDTHKNENFQPQDDKIIFQEPIQIAYNFPSTYLRLSYEILATFLRLAYNFHTILLPFPMTFLQSLYNFLITPLKLACDLPKITSITVTNL